MTANIIPSRSQRIKIKTVLISLLLASSSLAQDGSINERSLQHGSSLRSYLLYVPASYDGTTEWPLIVNYHGWGVDLASHMNITQMNTEADAARYIIAYPQGLEISTFGGTGPGWNFLYGAPNNPLRANQTDDIGFSLELIDHIRADYRINSSKIHLTGWSAGAGIAYEVACANPEIASVAAVASQMSQAQIAECSRHRTMSFLQIHGTADPSRPFNGFGSNWAPAPETAAYWANLNNCSSDPTSVEIEDKVTDDNSTVTLFEYTDCNNESEVLFYRINNGGHAWVGGIAPDWVDRAGTWNMDVNATTEILSFFDRNPLPQPDTAVETSTWGTVKSVFQPDHNE